MAALRQTLTWVKNSRGTPALIRLIPEGAGETYKKGALLLYDESEDGVVETGRAAGVPTTQLVLGIALQDASGVQGTDQDVLIPTADDIFVAALASDQDTVTAPGIDFIGDAVGLIKLSSTGGAGTEYVVDSGNVNWGRVIGLYGPDQEKRGGILSTTFVAGDRVLFQFLSSVVTSDGSIA